jgi:hypothetical protein
VRDDRIGNLIVNGDDFGRSSQVNRAILYCFRNELISSTSVMANGEAFEEACALARDNGLLDHVGLHVVLDDGVPLSTDIKQCNRLCDGEGRFRARANVLFMTREEKMALAKEVTAQIQRVRRAGLPITHMDSHHHVHELWSVLSVVLGVAGEHAIPSLRLAVNCGPLRSRSVRWYRRLVNRRIARRNLARTTYFGSLDNILWQLANAKRHVLASCEVMVHPTESSDGCVVDARHPDVPLDRRLPVELRGHSVSYSGHRYRGARAVCQGTGKT